MTSPTTDARTRSERAQAALGALPDVTMTGDEQVVVLLYEGLTALDLVGPHHSLASMMGARVHLLSPGPAGQPVRTDLGLITPTGGLDGCPQRVDVLLVPGGGDGTAALLRDERVLKWVADVGERAEVISSVCTGSLVLGAAGLLRGRRATSHWLTRDLLRRYGAIPIDRRVVVDEPVITAAGVSAGIDLGLLLVARLRGHGYAAAVELQAEYAPEPPAGTGTPALAGPDLTTLLRELNAPLVENLRST
jgi:cyclohexyl-isocyanide hydratase